MDVFVRSLVLYLASACSWPVQDVDEQDILLAFAFALRKQRLSSMYVADAPPPKRTRGGRPRSAK